MQEAFRLPGALLSINTRATTIAVRLLSICVRLLFVFPRTIFPVCAVFAFA
jgi:hypothetical protein